MRKSIARLVLLLVIFGLGLMVAPGHAFPLCPYDACYYYWLSCRESGGVPDVRYYGWCQDESYYLRGYGMAYCTTDAGTYEMGTCADW